MLRSLAAVSFLLTAFLSAAFSQNNTSTDTREFKVAGLYACSRCESGSAAVASVERQAFDVLSIGSGRTPASNLWCCDDLCELARLHSEDMANEIL